MYRAWYSTESFADYIIDHSRLKTMHVIKSKMYESDANNAKHFHTMPDHIRKILYLDAPDLIIEKDDDPVFSIEVSTEAGTGHNVFQRFARIAASVENDVPAFYIYPEAKIISRRNSPAKWDEINPLIFRALENVMGIYNIPALFYYFPSDFISFPNANESPHLKDSGLVFDRDVINYSGCPDSSDPEMMRMFTSINRIIDDTEKLGVRMARGKLLSRLEMRKHRDEMNSRFSLKSSGKQQSEMSPLSAVTWIPTSYLMN